MSRLLISSLTVASAALSWLPAQGPAFVPTPPLMDIRADQVQTILAQWPDTALGKLFADEVAIAAAKLGIDHTYNKFQRDRAVILAAQQLELPERLQPWQVRQLIGPPVYSLWRLLEHPAREVQSAEACLMMDPERGTRGDPAADGGLG